MKDGVITMNIKDRFYHERTWEGQEMVWGDWVKETDIRPDDPITRVCKVFIVQDSYLVWNFGGDYFWRPDDEFGYTDATTVIFMLNDKFQEPDINIPLNMIEGEWIAKDSEGAVSSRLIVKGANYTAYAAYGINIRQDNGEYKNVLGSRKTTGTISFDRGFFKVNVNNTKLSYEYKGIDRETGAQLYEYSEVDPNTLEAKEWITSEDSDYAEENLLYIADNCLYLQPQGYRSAIVFKKK